MAKIKPFISSVVSKQLPEFVREDYSTFLSFLEAYYEYLDQNYAKRNLKELRDIDDTLESFITYFKNEANCYLSNDFANCPNVDKRQFLRNIKQYYNAKGSEAAYKFLFRLLYNKEIEVFYPKSQILRASDGRWTQEISLFIEFSAGTASDALGKQFTITTSVGNQISVFVERVVQFSGNVYEVFVQRFYGTVSVGNSFSYNSGEILGEIVATTTSFEILDGGQGFTAGQIFDIADGAGGTGTKFKVTRVSSIGAITAGQIIDYGAGYPVNFIATLVPVVGVTDPTTFTLSENGVQQFSVPGESFTGGFSETGALYKIDYWSSTYADGTYVSSTTLGTFTSTFEAGVNTDIVALVRFSLGSIANYPGYYQTNDGFISDSIFIQDSYYYQSFSYVIKIDELLSSYKDIVKSYIHPSGLALFSEYQIVNEVTVGAELQAVDLTTRLYFTDSVIMTDSLIKDIYKPVTGDSVSFSDSKVFSLTKPLSDAATITESKVFTLSKPLSDLFYAYEDGQALTYELDRDFTDTQSIAESITLATEYNRSLSDSFGLTDNGTTYDLDVNNNLNNGDFTESATVSETGGLYLNPYTETDTYFLQDYVEGDEPYLTF